MQASSGHSLCHSERKHSLCSYLDCILLLPSCFSRGRGMHIHRYQKIELATAMKIHLSHGCAGSTCHLLAILYLPQLQDSSLPSKLYSPKRKKGGHLRPKVPGNLLHGRNQKFGEVIYYTATFSASTSLGYCLVAWSRQAPSMS